VPPEHPAVREPGVVVFRVQFKVFRSSFSSWDALFQEAAEYASTLPTDRLISISHSEDQNEGVVCVWYWEEVAPPAEEST
jgi:hypothetical protein